METVAPSSLYPSIDACRPVPLGTSPGNVVVVVPSNNANAEEEKRKYPRKNEALGCVQIVIAKIHFGLGGILLFSAKEFSPIFMNIWYPFWGGGLFFISGYLASLAATKPIEGLAAASHIFNTFSGLGAIAGTIILLIDLLKIFAINLYNVPDPYLKAVSFLSQSIFPLGCEGIFNMNDYCKVIKAYETGIVCVMLFFTLLQMGTAFSTLRPDKNKKKKDKSRSDNVEQNVSLLSLPPQYSAMEQTRYSQLPGVFHTSTFTEQPCDAATSETYVG
ncbi:B-lymphocyte antigen CD20-like isoform X1 [Elgaria multicarinata webbii]|uniref:B-lymphocyte antigen CD20-like isoform X1 n=1 Tax=Elgaria multicarinata webbii TaxID=159646 RepID=UPI002FCD05F2